MAWMKFMDETLQIDKQMYMENTGLLYVTIPIVLELSALEIEQKWLLTTDPFYD